MDFDLKTLDAAAVASTKTDAVLVFVQDKGPAGRDPLATLVAGALESGDLERPAGKTLSLYKPTGVTARRLVLASVGDGSAKGVRQATVAALAALKGAAVKKLVVLFVTQPTPEALRSATTAAADATYVYTTTRSKAEPRKLESVTFAVPDAAALKGALAEASAVVAGIEFAKEWGNRPPNHATPTMLGDAAKSIARGGPVEVQVLGPREVEKLGMGSFISVAKGSYEPLRFIVLQYRGAARTEAPVVLVGKGITFDTGGISIKPAAEMDEMKFDMSGAGSVLGVFRALSALQPAINVVGLIPTCENMPSGRSVKPGDVVTSMSGQTIEVLNTDAEGRLILCDALTYAERFKPAAVIDIATLTGACVIALGGIRSGLFASDESLATALQSAGEAAFDPCWRMPLDDEYAEGLKTNFADVANVAGRAGGAITAAKFLQRFAGAFPWAHLDVAGTAWKSGGAKGSTGRPVGLLMRYLLDRAAAATPAKAAKPVKTVKRAATKARKG